MKYKIKEDKVKPPILKVENIDDTGLPAAKSNSIELYYFDV